MKNQFVADPVNTTAATDDQVTDVWGDATAHHNSDGADPGRHAAGAGELLSAPDYSVAAGKENGGRSFKNIFILLEFLQKICYRLFVCWQSAQNLKRFQ